LSRKRPERAEICLTEQGKSGHLRPLAYLSRGRSNAGSALRQRTVASGSRAASNVQALGPEPTSELSARLSGARALSRMPAPRYASVESPARSPLARN
jgi:hypothetical protein